MRVHRWCLVVLFAACGAFPGYPGNDGRTLFAVATHGHGDGATSHISIWDASGITPALFKVLDPVAMDYASFVALVGNRFYYLDKQSIPAALDLATGERWRFETPLPKENAETTGQTKTSAHEGIQRVIQQYGNPGTWQASGVHRPALTRTISKQDGGHTLEVLDPVRGALKTIVLERHAPPIYSSAVPPDSQHLVAMQQIMFERHDTLLYGGALSPDGEHLVTLMIHGVDAAAFGSIPISAALVQTVNLQNGSLGKPLASATSKETRLAHAFADENTLLLSAPTVFNPAMELVGNDAFGFVEISFDTAQVTFTPVARELQEDASEFFAAAQLDEETRRAAVRVAAGSNPSLSVTRGEAGPLLYLNSTPMFRDGTKRSHRQVEGIGNFTVSPDGQAVLWSLTERYNSWPTTCYYDDYSGELHHLLQMSVPMGWGIAPAALTESAGDGWRPLSEIARPLDKVSPVSTEFLRMLTDSTSAISPPPYATEGNVVSEHLELTATLTSDVVRVGRSATVRVTLAGVGDTGGWVTPLCTETQGLVGNLVTPDGARALTRALKDSAACGDTPVYLEPGQKLDHEYAIPIEQSGTHQLHMAYAPREEGWRGAARASISFDVAGDTKPEDVLEARIRRNIEMLTGARDERRDAEAFLKRTGEAVLPVFLEALDEATAAEEEIEEQPQVVVDDTMYYGLAQSGVEMSPDGKPMIKPSSVDHFMRDGTFKPPLAAHLFEVLAEFPLATYEDKLEQYLKEGGERTQWRVVHLLWSATRREMGNTKVDELLRRAATSEFKTIRNRAMQFLAESGTLSTESAAFFASHRGEGAWAANHAWATYTTRTWRAEDDPLSPDKLNELEVWMGDRDSAMRMKAYNYLFSFLHDGLNHLPSRALQLIDTGLVDKDDWVRKRTSEALREDAGVTSDAWLKRASDDPTPARYRFMQQLADIMRQKTDAELPDLPDLVHGGPVDGDHAKAYHVAIRKVRAYLAGHPPPVPIP